MFAPFKSNAAVYGSVQVETGVASGDPHQLVLMLFDGALDAIVTARGALSRGDVPAKCKAVGKAARIVEEGLRAALNQRAGGDLAANLNNLYAYINARLTQANLRNDDEALQECHRLLVGLRDAWTAIQPAARRG